MPVIEEFVHANERFASTFDKGDLPIPPARQAAAVVCMDARLHPETFLGLDIGDAHVIRNAGGRVSEDALRSLIISNKLLGTREYVVVHHTDCGMLTFSNEDLHSRLSEETGQSPDLDFLPFSDLEQSVRDDVRAIVETPFLPDDVRVAGYVYDVRTGRLQEVVGPTEKGAARAA